MPLGSRSAQTPNESAQQSKSHAGGMYDLQALAGRLNALHEYTEYKVSHRWRKVDGDSSGKQPNGRGRRMVPHHSQIFIHDHTDTFLFSFGLFADDTHMTLLQDDSGREGEYVISESYTPNPLRVNGMFIRMALMQTQRECGPYYHLLRNNCQKFGRIFMTKLGASHHRGLLHP